MKIWQLKFGRHHTWKNERIREAWVSYTLNVEAKTAEDAIKEALTYGNRECFSEDHLSEVRHIGEVRE